MKKTTLLLSLFLLPFQTMKASQDALPEFHFEEWKALNATKAETLEWFQDAKFGMFIHWGLYAIPAGVWDGHKIHDMPKGRPTLVEWIQYMAEIPRAEYAQLAANFNPFLFDAEAIVDLAKRAGMQYLVITTKHHDGFAIYDSKVSDFDVMDATPFKRDIVRELHEACAAAGIAFGVYYSHNLDWADGSDAQVSIEQVKHDEPISTYGANTWDPSPNTFAEYLENKALPQVHELLTQYPDMKMLWYDIPTHMNPEQSWKFYTTAYELQPQMIINHRIGNGFGDYSIPGDNKIPDNLDTILKPWETVGTFNNSWGFSSYDQDWKTPMEILYWMVEIVSKGGNYMLNIGPTGLGGVPRESVQTLEVIGQWLKVNGEAVYGTRPWKLNREGPTTVVMAGTTHREKHGFSTTFTTEDFWFTHKDGCVYAISLAQADSSIVIKSLGSNETNVSSVELLGVGPVPFEQKESGLKVMLPEGFESPLGYVLKCQTSF